MTATDLLAPPMPFSTPTTVGGSTPPTPEPPTVELMVPVYRRRSSSSGTAHVSSGFLPLLSSELSHELRIPSPTTGLRTDRDVVPYRFRSSSRECARIRASSCAAVVLLLEPAGAVDTRRCPLGR